MAATNATLALLAALWAVILTQWSVREALYGVELVYRPWYAGWRTEHSLILLCCIVGTFVPVRFGGRLGRIEARQTRWRAEVAAATPALLAASMLLLTWATRFNGIAFLRKGSICWGAGGFLPPHLLWDPLWIVYLSLPAAAACLVALLGLRSALRLPRH